MMSKKRIGGLSIIAACLCIYFNGFGQTVAAKTPVKLYFEKVYLHTDRDYYSTGDDIWFKAYLVDAQTKVPAGFSNNLYVDLISPEAKVINSEIVYMNNGFGKGDFHLADSIPAGTYRLRAYTNWMRNFGDNFIFEKSLTVSNTLVDKRGAVAVTGGNTKGIATTPSTLLKGKSAIRFFPEGGSMVSGVTNIVAFKAEDPNGKNITVQAAVISSTGDTITHFNSSAAGVGVFVFVPEAGKTYTAKGVFNNNQPFTAALPTPLAKGYTLHVGEADSAHLRIIIGTNQATLDDNPDKEVTLAARHAGLRVLNASVKFDGLQISATLPKTQFPAGVSSITIYDKQLHPQCERLFFIPDSVSSKALSVSTDKLSYSPKGKVTLKIKATDPANHPLKADLSVAVVDGTEIPQGQGNIVSYLMLQSEVRGKIDHAEKLFDVSNANRFKQIDLLLMTQGWRDFVWRRLADTSLRISYPAENGFALTGTLREKFANKPIPFTNVSLTVKGAVIGQQYLSKTDSAGRYLFKGLTVVGKRPITLASFDEKRNKVGWLQMDSIDKSTPPTSVVRQYTVDVATETAFFNADAVRSRGKQRLSDTIKLNQVNIRGRNYDQLFDQTTTKFGYPDLKYDISSKYYFYNSLRDFMIHEIPGAHVNGADSVYFLGNQFNVETNRNSQTQIIPRFFANGREDVDDLNNGMYLDVTMDMINKVTVRHVLGQTVSAANSSGSYATGSNGDVFIVFLDIKPNAFDKVQLNTVSSHIDGYYEARTFYKPLYDNGKDLNKPDIRSTIHWEPNIVTDANGEATLSFFNADPKSNIRVVVQGITDKGVPVYATGSYLVK
ncbi:MG2 domain-containing protein [uncultured Mucilaginibacter sp.]|uniref:MG2 domain-containing protein n=1 Tax=uncultured Mucilaginibacter sp. TaxID=797541 RepID=UPI0025F564F4|nr:MG2 domain-containing protein [uncultured Mucilaginibacter sp.]